MSKHQYFKPTAIVIALAAVFPATMAWADEVEELTNPNVAEATVKLQYQDEVNPLYRQYNGVNKQGGNGTADLEVVQREETTWFKLNARNLGLRTQELEASYEKQGDWAVGLSNDQIPRFSPYEVRTAVTGVGSGTITQPSYDSALFASGKWIVDPTLKEVTLKTGRDITTLTASKYLSDGFKLGFSFKNEDKTGTRMSGVRGVGYSTSATSANKVNYYGGMLFAPEPIDQNHKQIELTADYATSQYQITAGYYGSFLNTQRDALSLIGGTNTQLIGATTTAASTLSPIALAPDNSAQQLYVNGAYNFSKDTRANFKVAYSEGRQSDSFLTGQPTAGLAVTGSDLGAKVETTEVFGSLTSRITKDLKVLASWRYEDQQDKTKVRLFYNNYPNNPESHTANKGKLEADYRLGAGYGLTAGLDYSNKSSPQWANGVYPTSGADKPVNTRKDVEEKTYRLALRKTMSQTVNGTLSLAHSERDGSDWVNETPVYPVYMSDRNRDKVRGLVDWAAAANVNLQFAYEAYFDQYVKSANGLDSGNGQVFSLDGSYTVNDDWKLNAWYSKQTGATDQTSYGQACTEATCSLTKTAKFAWDAKLKLDSDQFGLGLKGKIRKVEVGAEYLYSQDRNEQEINLPVIPAPGPVAGQGVLPDTKYVQNTFKLFASYPLDKVTTLRADYIYDLRKMDDYTWENWVYGDGTRVFVDPKQTTQIIGVSLSHKF